MRRPSARPDQSGPPFNATAARRLRAALGMGPERVAHDLRVSYGLPYVGPDLVIAWERGEVSPGTAEVTALAGVLWCSPADLRARPRTLREHRVVSGLAPEDVARGAGLDTDVYLRMEESDTWRGSERQATALAGVLGLTLPDFVTVTGRDPRLTELLRSAVTTRRPGHVRQIAKLVPLDRGTLESVLDRLHGEYQGLMTATLGRGGRADSGAAGRALLDRILEHFWTAVEKDDGR
ncbi:XRE family transcriptional regulator [Streptomyces ziwulingensis]|uniref:Helix-turn-helix transcriptional regulator n=1 Tax=Streptomyces ziwulingensis TaxID=1045501 RepID=A0ABP9B6C5_9ACTN